MALEAKVDVELSLETPYTLRLQLGWGGLGFCPHLRQEIGLARAGSLPGVSSMTQGQVGL